MAMLNNQRVIFNAISENVKTHGKTGIIGTHNSSSVGYFAKIYIRAIRFLHQTIRQIKPDSPSFPENPSKTYQKWATFLQHAKHARNLLVLNVGHGVSWTNPEVLSQSCLPPFPTNHQWMSTFQFSSTDSPPFFHRAATLAAFWSNLAQRGLGPSAEACDAGDEVKTLNMWSRI